MDNFNSFFDKIKGRNGSASSEESAPAQTSTTKPPDTITETDDADGDKTEVTSNGSAAAAPAATSISDVAPPTSGNVTSSENGTGSGETAGIPGSSSEAGTDIKAKPETITKSTGNANTSDKNTKAKAEAAPPVKAADTLSLAKTGSGIFGGIASGIANTISKSKTGLDNTLKLNRITGLLSNEEPVMDITEITNIPTDFDFINEDLADDECYRITFEIIKAEGLAAMDNNGLSDPYVALVLSKDVILKTNVIQKTLDPEWHERFQLHIDCRCALANILVYDHDMLGMNDRIGYVDFDLASIPPFHRYTTTEKLGSCVEGEEDVGTITFSYMVEIVSNAKVGKIESIGTKGKEKLLGVVQVTVIEGIELPPMNSDGSCDPFVKLQLGNQSHSTKVIHKTLNPKWRESLEFQYLSTSGTILQISLWDFEAGFDSHNFIGDTEIDLDELDPNKPLKYIFTLDGMNTKVSFLIKILKFAELGAAELQLQKEHTSAETKALTDLFSLANTSKEMSSVGYMIVKVIRATNIPGKKLGNVDPYVVLEVENCRAVSPVREGCLEPEWNLTYRFPINDYHSVLYLSLYDEEDLVNDVLIGRVAVPLFNCHGLKRFTLKDATLTDVGKGELSVELAVFYNPLRAAVRTFKPKEEIIIKEPTKFDVALLQRDVKRITTQIEKLQDMGEGLDQVLRWRSRPTSLVSMVMFVLIVHYIELWMVPLGISCLLSFIWLCQRLGIKPKESWVRNNLNKPYYEAHKGPTDGESSGFTAKLDKMKAIFTTAEGIQKGLDFAASIGEKFGHIGQWKVPLISAMCTVILAVASVLLYHVSLRYVILVWGLNKFRKFYLKPNLVDNNELVDLLSRVPSFPEIEQYRQIRNKQRREVGEGGGDNNKTKKNSEGKKNE